MADRYLLESGAPDGYLLEDGSGVLLLEAVGGPVGQSTFTDSPIRKKFYGYSEVFVNLLLTTLATAAVVNLERATVFTPNAPRQQQQEFVQQNLNLTTLSGGEVAAPFAQRDWTNPPAAKRTAVYEQPNILLTTLTPTTVGVVPRGALYAPRSATPQQPAFIQPNLNLTTLSGGVVASPFRQTDWSSPVRIARVQQSDYTNLLSTLLAPSTASPFSQTDWPLPVRVSRTQQLDTGNLLSTLLSPAAVVLVPREALYTPRAAVPQQPAFIQPNLNLTTLSGAVATPPFHQTDWPNPSLRVYQSLVFDFPDLLNTTLTPIVAGGFILWNRHRPGAIGR